MDRYLLKLAVVLMVVAAASCELEPCKNYVCVNGDPQEDYKDCVCICRSGWDGADCSIEDKCVTRNVQCVAGQGNCNKSTGTCVCFTGYEGDSCQIFSRDKFLDGDSSIWRAVDTCACSGCVPTVYIYEPVRLEAGTDNKSLDVYNIRDLDETIFAIVNADGNTFSQRSTVDFGPADISSLRGTISGDKTTIRVTYVSTEGVPYNCSGKWTRQ
jgi:hypothetical protein